MAVNETTATVPSMATKTVTVPVSDTKTATVPSTDTKTTIPATDSKTTDPSTKTPMTLSGDKQTLAPESSSKAALKTLPIDNQIPATDTVTEKTTQKPSSGSQFPAADMDKKAALKTPSVENQTPAKEVVTSAALKTPSVGSQIPATDAVTRSVSKTSTKGWGLQILVAPKDEDDVDIDIVAVHGIGVNDPNDAWVHADTKVNWLKDASMLPAALPKARIMAYNYVSYWHGENAVKQKVGTVAGKLLNALDGERTTCAQRPILFVGHCFGGLVIQEAYNMISMQPEDNARVAHSIAGVVFLGTPHRGILDRAAFSTLGQLYHGIAQTNIPIQDNALHTMAQENEVLVKVVHNFTRRTTTERNGGNGPELFCFFEMQPMLTIMNGAKVEFLVDEDAATLNCHEKEGLTLNHFGLNKFEAADDASYKEVRNRLVKIASNIQRMTDSPRLERSRRSAFPSSTFAKKRHIPSLAAPIAREAYFAKRNKILDIVEDRFHKSMHVALVGELGHGKTHVAVEYAHKFHEQHPDALVHWVNAGSVTQFEASYRRIGETLRLSKKKLDKEDVFELVHDEMRRDVGGWLMVLDGLDNKAGLVRKDKKGRERSILDFVPKSPRARILITTRSRSLAMEMVNKRADCVIDVKALPEGDASYLLYGSEVTDDAKKKGAADVSKKLGGSAGLLVLAHIYRTAIGQSWRPKTYLNSICASPESKDGEDPALKAWELIYQIIKEKDANAAHLLLLMGSLDVQAISTVLFDREQWKQIDQLVEYGMVEPSTDRRLYTVTPLIRRCVQMWLVKNKEQDDIRDHALSVMCEKFPFDDIDSAELLMSCALVILNFKPVSTEAKRNRATLLFKVGQHHVRMGRRLVGLADLKECLSLQENDKSTKPEVIETTKKTVSDAEALEKQHAKDIKAQPPKNRDDAQLESARAELGDLEKQKGKDHGEVVDKASKLADILALRENESDQAEATMLYQRKEKWLRDNKLEGDIDMARNHFSQAFVYENRGQLEKAVALYQSASEVFQRHLGPNSPELLRAYGNLASLYCRQGQTEAGKQFLAATLQNQRTTLGEDHPETLITRRNIAMTLGESGKVDIAKDQLLSIVLSQQRLCDEPALLQTTCSIADIYKLHGEYKDAREMLEATLARQEGLLGKTHRDTVKTRQMLQEVKAAEKTKRARPKEKTPVVAQVSAKG